MGFDGVKVFSGMKTGNIKPVPHAVFVHCHCHMLQLACAKAANSTPGIKHVYVTLSLEIFSLFFKRTECFHEVQYVLDFLK